MEGSLGGLWGLEQGFNLKPLGSWKWGSLGCSSELYKKKLTPSTLVGQDKGSTDTDCSTVSRPAELLISADLPSNPLETGPFVTI